MFWLNPFQAFGCTTSIRTSSGPTTNEIFMFCPAALVKGRGSGFSVEAPEGVRFLIRSRLFTDAEAVALESDSP